MANQPTKYKKFLAGAASATLVATAIVPTALAADATTAATDFSDVAATHTHYAAIMQAVERGLFNGYTDGTFKPENTIDRKGVVKSLANYVVSQSDYKTYEEYITGNKLVDKVTPFTDVPATHGDKELFNASLIVKDSGIFTGSNNNLMPANVITRQQMAKVLVNGFGLKDLAGVESKVTDTDKAQAEYVDFINILSENGVTEVTTYNPTSPVKRGQMASFLNRAYDSAHKVVAPETATKVVSVSATNLKEVVVAFDGSVDAKTAANEDNYTIDGGLTVETASLSEDGKTVTLTLDSKMTNQTEYKLAVKNVKAGDKVLEVKDFAFTPLDTTLPTVEKVEALGNKAVKVTFSEPIDKTSVQIGDFKLDDKAIAGSVESEDGRSVIVKTYTKLADGEHTLAVSGVKDFADYTIVSTSQKFNVVEDKAAPTISEVSATFESVTVKFSEPVQNVKGGSYAFWKTNKDSSVKHNSSTTVTKLADDTYRFEFSNADKLPGYEVMFYATGIKDYSDNTIASDTPVAVSAVIDQTRPEVTSAEVNETDYKSIEIKFSKAISNITNRASYVLKDEDGKVVSIKGITPGANDRSAKVEFYSALEEGTYTLSLEGLKDKTTLQNSILPYTLTLEVGDNTSPELEGVAKEGRYITVQFSEEMSLEGTGSIAELNNYLVQYKGTFRALPAGTSIQVLDGSDAVMLILPEKIDGVNYDAAQLTAVTVQGVKDVNGKVLKNYSATETNLASTFAIANKSNGAKNVTLVNPNTISVVFNQAIGTGVSASDFTVANNFVDSAEVDGSKVTLTLRNDVFSTTNTNVSFAAGAFKSILGTDVSVASTVAVVDSVKPELVEITNVTANELVLDFNEDILGTYATQMAADFVVTRVNGGKELIPTVDYDTTVVSGNVVITLDPTATNVAGTDSVYTVALKSTNTFVTDVASNKAVVFGATAAPNNYDIQLPTFTASITGTNQISVVFSEEVNEVDAETVANYVYDVNGATAGGTETVLTATLQADGRTVVLTTTTAPTAGTSTIDADVEDLDGNASASAVKAL